MYKEAPTLSLSTLTPDEIRVRNSGIVEGQVIDDRGDGILTVYEANKRLPFVPMRIYDIQRFKQFEAVRGHHAHRDCQQVVFCRRGSFRLDLDDGYTKQSIKMQTSPRGVILGTMLWHEMTQLTRDCFILVFAQYDYNEADYVRDYQEFFRLARQ